MPRKKSLGYKLSQLTKGQIRKLNALKKSLGDEIGARAFGEWFTQFSTEPKVTGDKNANVISSTLEPLAKKGKLRIPRGGYLVTRGRGRVIVQRVRKG